MPILRIGVIMGGKSIEREVSFNSGRTICDHLDTQRYDIVPIFQTADGKLYKLPWQFLYRGKTSDFEHRLTHEAQEIYWDDLPTLIDFAYLAVHGRFAEDGTMQGFLEILGVPYLGSRTFASALSMNKTIQKTFLSMHGIETPNGITIPAHQACDITSHIEHIVGMLKKNNLHGPWIVKPTMEGSSIGVSLATNEQELCDAIHAACVITPGKKQPVLIEERIEGMEFSCITIVDYKTGQLVPLPPTEIVIERDTHVYDYDQKYMPGRAHKFTPPRCAPDIIKNIQETCVVVTKVLEIKTISRIDGFVTKDNRVVIVDPNTLSGMGPASFVFREAAEINMSHTDLINHLIETDLHELGILQTIELQEQKEAMTMHNKKIRVAVLMGGASHEREISLESGRNVTYKLSPHKYDPIPLFVNSNMELYKIPQSLLVRNSTHEIEHLVTRDMKVSWHQLPDIADFVFIGLHGGHGENGNVQGTLEMLGLPYNGSSVLTSALCMDKFKTAQFLLAKGFDVPKGILVAHNDWQDKKETILNTITSSIAFPCIVKPHDDGCSVMVQKINSQDELEDNINMIFSDGKTHALVEECVMGMELTVGVLGNEQPKALPASQAIATHDILSIEEKFLPGAGENQTPAPLPKVALECVQKTMEDAYVALGCKGYARIDCFYQTPEESPTGHERIVILEVNTLPGMTPATCIFHQAAELGIKPMEFIDKIIECGFEEHKTITQKIQEKHREQAS